MNISYNEFHIGKKIRDLCQFDGKLYSSSGNVVIKDLKNVKIFTEKLNQLFDKRNQSNKRVAAGSVNAMGLIDEIFHYVCMIYRRDKNLEAFKTVLSELEKTFTKSEVDKMLSGMILFKKLSFGEIS